MPGAGVYLAALVIALLAALAGAAQAVLRATRLAARGGTRAAGTDQLSADWAARLSARPRNSTARSRMVARRILRFPRRSADHGGGHRLAMALMVTTQHFPLSMNRIIEVTFGVAQRMDVMVTFSEAADDAILRRRRRACPAC